MNKNFIYVLKDLNVYFIVVISDYFDPDLCCKGYDSDYSKYQCHRRWLPRTK